MPRLQVLILRLHLWLKLCRIRFWCMVQARWHQLQRLMSLLPGDKALRWAQHDPLVMATQEPKRFTVGAWIRGPMAGLHGWTCSFPWTTRVLMGIARTWSEEHAFTTVTLSMDTMAAPHKDMHNLASSLNLALPCSEFEGGELFVGSSEGQHRLAMDGPRGHMLSTQEAVLFPPRELHASLPWRGDRLLMVVYHIASPQRLCNEDRRTLRACGCQSRWLCDSYA